MKRTIVSLGCGDLLCGALQGLQQADNFDVIGVLPWERLQTHGIQSRMKACLVPGPEKLARQFGMPLLPPVKANSEAFAGLMAELRPQILLVSGWGEILQAPTLALPSVASVNVHPSLLPKHRGFNPVSSVLRAGEKETGITLHEMTPQIDAGRILFQSALPISSCDDGDSLTRKLAFRLSETICNGLANVGAATFKATDQDESQASCPKKLSIKEVRIQWDWPAQRIHNHIRGCVPWFRPYCVHKKRVLQILKTQVVPFGSVLNAKPGTVLFKQGCQFVVATGDPKVGLLVMHSSVAGALKKRFSKWYCLSFIQVGDCLQ